MAIYSFQCSIISRTQTTNNAVGKAAYINRDDYQNEYDGTRWKFKNRSDDVGFSAVMLPENCPERFANPATLWNEVETFNKRKDARLARDFIVALPNELSLEQNKALVEDFIKTNFTDEGMIANYAIHTDDPNNIHCHILATTNEVTAEGFAKKNTKGREWNKPEYLIKWRESLAEKINQHLKENNINKKVDHRSVEKQKEDVLNKAMNADTKQKELEHLREFMKLENIQVQERVSRKEFENNPNIKVERAELKKQTLERNREVDNFINNKIVDLKRVKPEKEAPKQTKKRSSKMINIIDTISNLYEDLKNSISKTFNPQQSEKNNPFKNISKSSGSSKKRKQSNDEDEFNGNVIDAVALREEENLKNKKAPKPGSGSSNNKDKDENKKIEPLFKNKEDDDKKLSSSQQFAKNKKIMQFAYQSDNLENFIVVADVEKNKRPNAMRAIGSIKKPETKPYFGNDKNAQNGFSKFESKQNNSTAERKEIANDKKKENNQSKSMNDFENKQNANIRNRQQENNTQKSENKAPAPKR